MQEDGFLKFLKEEERLRIVKRGLAYQFLFALPKP